MLDVITQSKKIEESAARLHRLYLLKAPSFIIELERQLLVKKILRLQIDNRAQILVDELNNKQDIEMNDFLAAHGYFKGVEDPDEE